MPAPRGSTLDRLLGRLGGVLEEVEHAGRGKAGAREAGFEAQRVAAAWILGRTLRPRHINWPRLLAATATGVVLGEVAEALIGPRRRGRQLPPGRTRVLDEDAFEEEAPLEERDRAADEIGPEADELSDVGPRSARQAAAEMEVEEEEDDLEEVEEAYAEEMDRGPRSRRRALARADEQEVEDLSYHLRHMVERAGGDLAIAATYAAIAYPRIPGPRWLRAAVFAAGDIALASGGGVATSLSGLAPRMRLPLSRLLPEQERRVEHSLALALALAVIYRDEEEEDED